MDQSRRAVESYWRSKMIVGATSDEDKVTPVYKLQEICDLLRSSHVYIVKEVSEFILKRLQHKSPIVKQKALRIIKYAVGKSGSEFRREMQRNSVDVRQLIHYKGHPDPLKGDALNKFVRETAQEALSALFSSDDNKPTSSASNLGNRIQGFGSTNFEMPSEDRKSFITEVVDIGSATIKQGLSNLAQSQSMRKNSDNGSYRGPNLRRSLTRESESSDQYDGISYNAEFHNNSRLSKNTGSGNLSQSISASKGEMNDGGNVSNYGEKTREEKLLETIVTSGGVRLQPTRDSLHAFLVEASKLNVLALAYAIESKLASPMWQVRMKSICVLEAVLRKNDDNTFSVISSYFIDKTDVVVKCSESPHASLREKANKVLGLLGGGQISGIDHVEKSVKTPENSMMVNLIDTGDQEELLGVIGVENIYMETRSTDASTSVASQVTDLLGDNFDGSDSLNLEDDPFRDVSFHICQEDKGNVVDLFSGMTDDKSGVAGAHTAPRTYDSETFDLFNSSSEGVQECEKPRKDVDGLMDSLSINNNDPFVECATEKVAQYVSSVLSMHRDDKNLNKVFNANLASQATGINVNPTFPLNSIAYNFAPGLMFNPSLAPQPMNYNVVGNLIAQQQSVATMSNFQQLGNLHSNAISNAVEGQSSPFPDIFNPVISSQPSTTLMKDSKREETKAFDFVSDHLAAARGPKRLV